MNQEIRTIQAKKKRLSLLLASCFMILVLSGCSLPFSQKTADRDQPEVLIAQECGMDGLKCCADEPKCSFGQQCCVSPNDNSLNQCADSCGCGGKDQFCCAGQQCNSGYICGSTGRCEPCGQENQACCQGDPAAACATSATSSKNSLVCFNQRCVACGRAGNPCCAGNLCTPADSKNGLAECMGDLCRTCGGNEQPACLAGDKCAKNFLLSNGNCYICGGINQPCCPGKACNVGSGLSCVDGACK